MQRHREEPLRVLIVSATVGAGDAGNARELARRLHSGGDQAVIKDFLDAAPFGLGKALSKGYEAELRHAPWAYELAFGLWYWAPFLLRPLSRLLSLFTRRAMLRWVRQYRPDVVVSTYPIATQVLGDLRRRANKPWRLGRRAALQVPVVNFITDFGYHPFWAHRAIDLNLAVHPSTVAAVANRSGRPSMACAPLVGPQFAAARTRRPLERARLGLGEGDVAALISSGSWGIGTVRESLELLTAQPDLVPVVVCGHNDALRKQLEQAVGNSHRAVVLGWTDDMAGLMAAADVLVENAGGLTSLEAMGAGLPLVSFRPIPGHGCKSAAVMASAGVSRFARSPEQLVSSVRDLGRPGWAREAQLRAAGQLFSADAADAVAQVAVWGPPPLPRLRPVVRAVRVAYSATLVGALAWFGMTTGVGVAAAAAGAGVAHPPAGHANAVYLGVRLNRAELSSSVVEQDLRALHASAVLEVSTARLEGAEVHRWVAAGISLESGGVGFQRGAVGAPVAPWSVARMDSQSVHVLSTLAGCSVAALVPDRSISAFDLVDASSAHVKMVVPNTTLPVPPSGPFPQSDIAVPELQSGHVYVVDGRKITPLQLTVLLGELGSQLRSQRLPSAPLSGLQ